VWKDLIFRKLNEFEFRKQHQIKISKGFTGLETLSDSEDTNMTWEKITVYIKMHAKVIRVL